MLVSNVCAGKSRRHNASVEPVKRVRVGVYFYLSGNKIFHRRASPVK
jgi:hypothetical protein